MSNQVRYSPGFCKRILDFLHAEFGDTSKEIGQKAGVKESQVSLVRRGERSLSLDKLLNLEASYGVPLPLLIVMAHGTEDPNFEFAEDYGNLKTLLQDYYIKLKKRI